MDTSTVIQSISILFSEAYTGPVDLSSTWFVDNEPDSGILGIISHVSSVEASWSSNNNEPGTSIAGHIEHLCWSLANTNCALQCNPFQGNWKESWNTLDTDEAKWEELKSELRFEFESLLETIQHQKELSGDYLPGVMALIPHAAYHLGTIHQLIERAHEHTKTTQKSRHQKDRGKHGSIISTLAGN
jgi:hypothetical protein